LIGAQNAHRSKIGKKAIVIYVGCSGARGPRSIMEAILLDFMFDLPSLEGVKEVMISQQVVEGTPGPLYGRGKRAI
jgi:ATP-dependent Clp protease ATP-binding subunit ClpX